MSNSMTEKMKELINETILRKVPVISSFDSIVFTRGRPLVICDIDETILYLDSTESYKSYNSKFPLFYSKHHSLLSGANYCIDPLYRYILPTDIEGFRRLEQRISSLDGKLIFLTARHPSTSRYVVEDFSRIGLDSSKYEIHYTGNTITKGEYIRARINLSGYNNLYFIDDLKDNIVSVYHFFPQTNLYLFRRIGL